MTAQNLLDFGPAPRAEFLAGTGMFGSGAARTIEGLWFNDAGAYAAGFHLVIGMWFECGSRDWALGKSRFRRFRTNRHTRAIPIVRESDLNLKSHISNGRTEITAAAASVDIGALRMRYSLAAL
jgi:hypothetical protein